MVHQILAELGSSFVNANSVPDDLCAALRCVWELAALHPSRLKSRYGVDGIEQTQELDSSDRPGEGFSEPFHEPIHLSLFLAVFLSLLSICRVHLPGLPLRKGLPRKLDHFLISVREETDMVNHLSKESSDV